MRWRAAACTVRALEQHRELSTALLLNDARSARRVGRGGAR